MAKSGTMIIQVVQATVPPGDTGTKRACVKRKCRDAQARATSRDLPVTSPPFLRATTTEHDTPRLTRTAVELRDGPEDRQTMKTKMQDVDKAMVLTFNATFEL